MIRQPIISVLGHVDHGKCVAGDTLIGMGDGRLLSAREIFDKYRKGVSVKVSGGEVYESTEITLLSAGKDGIAEPKRVSHVWKLKSKRLVHVSTSAGYDVKTTPEHKFLIFTKDGKMTYCEAASMREGETLLLPSKTILLGSNDTVSRLSAHDTLSAYRTVTVTKVVHLEGDFDVYDFTVEDTHNFIANSLIIHNTTLLDKIRQTTIVSKESGGITQHIGASEVPIDVIRNICKGLQNFDPKSLRIPGLLFIDTPGHEAFTNLRRRGGSIADLAILVIDVMDGMQPQTVEAIEILREYKTPFVIAANKVDTLSGWQKQKTYSISESLGKQYDNVKDMLNTKLFELIGEVSRYGFQSNVYTEVRDFQKEIAIVPISAITGEGTAELLMLVAGLSQRFLEMKLNIEVDGPGRGAILERKEIRGLGTVIDVILYDGALHAGDTIAFADEQGKVQTTKIRALLKPKPMREIRESASEFVYIDSASAATGVRISAVGLDDAIVGSTVIDSSDPDYIKNIRSELKGLFKTEPSGPVLKADSIGGIEGLSKIFGSMGVPISKKAIGNVTKRDILDAFSMNAINQAYATVLAFNVNIEPDAQEAASASGVNVIRDSVIYKIMDDYKALVEKVEKSKKEAALGRMVLPAKVKVLPNSCFRISHPAVFGVEVMVGTIRPGVVMINEVGARVGKIKEIQNEKSPLREAKAGAEVAVSMDEPMFGRQVRENQVLYTKIRRQDAMLLKGEFSSLINENEADLLDEILGLRYGEE